VPFTAERGYQMIFGAAAGAGIGRMHPPGELGPEEGVVLDVEPEHRRSRRAPERGGRLDQLVGPAIVVRLAADAPAAARGESDYRLHRGKILAGERNRSPAACGLADDDGAV